MNPLRVGFLGVRRGLPLLRACQERSDLEVLGVSDRDTEQLGAVSAGFNIPFASTDAEKLLALDGLDAVFIATSDREHRKQIAAALGQGLHVYCAGPLTHTPEDCRSLISSAKHHRERYVMVGHAARFHAFCQCAHRVVKSGDIGAPYLVRVELYQTADAEPDAPSADAAMASHPFVREGYAGVDLARLFAGELVSVNARSIQKVMLELPFDDTLTARYVSAQGAVAEVLLAYGARRPPCLVLSILGTDGALHAASISRQNAWWSHVRGEITRHELPADPTDTGVGALLDEFVTAIRTERRPVPGLVDGVRTVSAAVAAVQSAAAGGDRVDIADLCGGRPS